MTLKNIFDHLPADFSEEQFESIIHDPKSGVLIERIVSRAHATPDGEWLVQKKNEWVILLKGEATLEFREPEKVVNLKPGDHIEIPSGQKHRVVSTALNTETIWVALHF